MEKDTIVVVTNKYDATADLVIAKLNDASEKIIRLNTEDFPMKIRFVFNSEKGQMEFYLPQERVIEVSRVKSVWYRKPAPHNIDSEVNEGPIKKFAQRETESIMRAFYECFDGFWMSHPLRIRAASQKVYQLQLARRLSFSIPVTLVTNDPKRAREFCIRFKENGVIVKPLSYPIVDADTGSYSFSTALVGEEYLERLEQVRLAPTLFQVYVPKKHELRITVVGTRVFTCEIHSQVSEQTELDWRGFDANDPIPHKIGSLPKELGKKILEMVRMLDLSFGAIDMIFTPEEKYVFLELNPNGQWGWIEILTGMPISQAIADLLIKGGN